MRLSNVFDVDIALLRLFGTNRRKLSLIMTLFLCLSLGQRHSSSGLSLFPLLSSTLPGSSASEVTTLWHYTNMFIISIIISIITNVPSVLCLQCFDAVGWLPGRTSGL